MTPRRTPTQAAVAMFLRVLVGLSCAGPLGAALFHPVCAPIGERERPAFQSVYTLPQRAARGEPFKQIDGRWYQCKAFVSRVFFF